MTERMREELELAIQAKAEQVAAIQLELDQTKEASSAQLEELRSRMSLEVSVLFVILSGCFRLLLPSRKYPSTFEPCLRLHLVCF